MKNACLKMLGLVLAVLLVGCGRQEGQPYVLTGTLTTDPALRLDYASILNSRGRVDLVMTARTGPDAADIVLQRRWRNVRTPHEFGLGKGRVKAIGSKQLYVTARLDVFIGRGQAPWRTLVGWTREPVAAGTRHVRVKLDHDLMAFPGSKETGKPTGGWHSDTVIEDPAPPGLERKDRGKRLFSGIIDVPEEHRARMAGSMLRRASLFITAGPQKGGGAPTLIHHAQNVEFPLRFSLHANDVLGGMSSGPVNAPQWIAARYDLDGSVDTQWDSVRVTSETQIAPGTKDIKLTLPVDELLEKVKDHLETQGSSGGHGASPHGASPHGASPHGASPHGASPHGASPHGASPHGNAAGNEPTVADDAVVYAGEFVLAAGMTVPKTAVLFVTLRDGAGQLALIKREPAPTVPFRFELKGADFRGYAGDANGPMTLKAHLCTTGDPLQKSPDDLIGILEGVKGGTTDIKLELKKQP